MKSVLVFVVVLVAMVSGSAYAQSGRDRDAFFTPGLRSVWLEGLVLGLPAAGLGVDLDAARSYEDSDSSSAAGLGIRGYFGAGYPLQTFALKYNSDFYVDFDLLLRGALVVEGFSAALLTGYGYRIWNRASELSSGHRLKLGVEMNYALLNGRIIIRGRAMGAMSTANGDTELGPVALGVAIGWFREK